MKRWFLVLLLACGSEKTKPADRPAEPAPRKPPMVVDAAPAPEPATPLEEARSIIKSKKRRDPTAFVALAHAEAAAKQVDSAKQTLADGLEVARADKTSEGAKALAQGVEVYVALGDAGGAAKLLDETIERVKNVAFNDDVIATLLSPVFGLEHVPLIEGLAALLERYDKIGERVAPGSPGWNAVVKHVGTLELGDRVSALVELAKYARHAGNQAIASELVKQALPLAMQKADELAGTVLATELGFAGEKAAARKVLAIDAKRVAKEDAADRATSHASLAEAYALLGDKAVSAMFERKALADAAKAKDELDEDDEYDEGKVGDTMWMYLAIARALRDDVDGALAIAKERNLADAIAWWLVQHGKLDAVDRVLALLEGEKRRDSVEGIVAWLARHGDLAAAEERAVAGIEHVMRAYALRGDLAKVEELGKRDEGGFKNIQLDAFTDLAGRILARQGKCAEAVAATKRVAVNRGEAMAIAARYCPDSKL